jgi:ribosomal protein S2
MRLIHEFGTPREDINMSNPYIARVEKMVSSKDIEMSWSTLEQAKRYIANIQQLQREIRLVKSEITLAKQQVHSNYTDKKVHVGKGFGAGVATGLFGARKVGKLNSLTRNSIRHNELKAIEPYVEAERYIAQVLAGLDSLKLQMKTWIATQ